MKYQDYLDDQSKIQDREERQDKMDRFLPVLHFPSGATIQFSESTGDKYQSANVDLAEAIRIAIGEAEG